MGASLQIRGMEDTLRTREYLSNLFWENLRKSEAAEKEAKALLLPTSTRLSNLIPDPAEWESFWAPVADDISAVDLLALLKTEIAKRMTR